MSPSHVMRTLQSKYTYDNLALHFLALSISRVYPVDSLNTVRNQPCARRARTSLTGTVTSEFPLSSPFAEVMQGNHEDALTCPVPPASPFPAVH